MDDAVVCMKWTDRTVQAAANRDRGACV